MRLWPVHASIRNTHLQYGHTALAAEGCVLRFENNSIDGMSATGVHLRNTAATLNKNTILNCNSIGVSISVDGSITPKMHSRPCQNRILHCGLGVRAVALECSLSLESVD